MRIFPKSTRYCSTDSTTRPTFLAPRASVNSGFAVLHRRSRTRYTTPPEAPAATFPSHPTRPYTARPLRRTEDDIEAGQMTDLPEMVLRVSGGGPLVRRLD